MNPKTGFRQRLANILRPSRKKVLWGLLAGIPLTFAGMHGFIESFA